MTLQEDGGKICDPPTATPAQGQKDISSEHFALSGEPPDKKERNSGVMSQGKHACPKGNSLLLVTTAAMFNLSELVRQVSKGYHYNPRS